MIYKVHKPQTLYFVYDLGQPFRKRIHWVKAHIGHFTSILNTEAVSITPAFQWYGCKLRVPRQLFHFLWQWKWNHDVWTCPKSLDSMACVRIVYLGCFFASMKIATPYERHILVIGGMLCSIKCWFMLTYDTNVSLFGATRYIVLELLKNKCLYSWMWPQPPSRVSWKGTLLSLFVCSGAKEWMILNPRGSRIDSEHWGIWVSTSKTTYSRCGVRLKCCGEPQGLIEHIELRFSGLSRCSEDSQAAISGPLLAWRLLILLTKAVRLLFT